MSETTPSNANETCVAGTESAGKVSSCDGCPNQKACSTGEGLPKPEVVGLGNITFHSLLFVSCIVLQNLIAFCMPLSLCEVIFVV
jgi:hypothetical protein